MEQLVQSVESALSLATHAEGWTWKEETPQGIPSNQRVPLLRQVTCAMLSVVLKIWEPHGFPVCKHNIAD
jgi:hypothetical protein